MEAEQTNELLVHEGWIDGTISNWEYKSFEDGRDPWDAPVLLSARWVESLINNLSGKVLTIVDASMPTGEQRKAVKDLIHSVMADGFVEVHYRTSDDKFTEYMAGYCTSEKLKKEEK